MPKYTVGKSWLFPELGRYAYPGDTIELPEDVAKRYMHNEPGLLAPARERTVGNPKKEVRGPEDSKPAQEKTSGKPKKHTRKKK